MGPDYPCHGDAQRPTPAILAGQKLFFVRLRRAVQPRHRRVSLLILKFGLLILNSGVRNNALSWNPLRNRTVDLLLIISTLPCGNRASCTESTARRSHASRRPGIIRAAGPRPVPHRSGCLVTECDASAFPGLPTRRAHAGDEVLAVVVLAHTARGRRGPARPVATAVALPRSSSA
jgi:hypothetical protein